MNADICPWSYQNEDTHVIMHRKDLIQKKPISIIPASIPIRLRTQPSKVISPKQMTGKMPLKYDKDSHRIYSFSNFSRSCMQIRGTQEIESNRDMLINQCKRLGQEDYTLDPMRISTAEKVERPKTATIRNHIRKVYRPASAAKNRAVRAAPILPVYKSKQMDGKDILLNQKMRLLLDLVKKSKRSANFKGSSLILQPRILVSSESPSEMKAGSFLSFNPQYQTAKN